MNPRLGPDSPVALVTGASRGIGLAISRRLAAQGWQLVAVARDSSRLDNACAELERRHPGCVQQLAALDLAEQAQVRVFASRLLAAGRPLRAIVHNAGVMCMQRELTRDGLERTWATNVVAPHLLTRLLQPLLPVGPAGRVVFMSSLVRRWGALALDDPGLALGYTPDKAYNQSKLALLLLARAWAGRQPGWLSLSMEPGMTDTDFGSGYTGFRAWIRRLYRPFMATPAQAADTAVWLATVESRLLEAGGHYRRRRRVPLPGRAGQDNLPARLIERLDHDAP